MTSPATARQAARRVPPLWNFADKARKIRRDVLQIEQAVFAEQLNVTRQRYAAWESGRTQPRDMVALAKRIELISGVPAAWILGVESDPQGDPDGATAAVDTGSHTHR